MDTPTESASASCTWGDGPDVLVVVERENLSGFGLLTLHQRAELDRDSFGLTIREARRLAHQLLNSADRAEQLEKEYTEYAKREQERAKPQGG